MATIPIEVIVQDGPSPEPTPTPSDSGETNIVVPDTGAGTVENGSNGGGIGSATNIILPAIILVLAIGAIVAIMVHRYQKRKKVNDGIKEYDTKESKRTVSRKERLATVASGTIAIFAATVLVGNLVIPATKATTSVEPGTAELDTVDKITIIATREQDSDEVVATVKNTSYATANLDFGYKVTTSMIEGATTANLYLDGDETSQYYIAPVSGGALADNTWGYTLEEPSEATTYLPIPLVDTPATITKGNDMVEDEAVDIYYAIKVDKDLPAGSYIGELEYTLTDNNFPVTLTTMQGMTTEICENTFTPGNQVTDPVPTATLEDIRDHKTYTIAKLADGKCWMTQNLDLQKEGLTVALNSDNTDHPANGFTLLASQTDGNESWYNRFDKESSTNTPHVYNLSASGETYKYCMRDRYGNCEEYGDDIPATKLGNLYNWYAATAGTGTYDTGGEGSEDAAGSICPANWRLPNNSSSRMATDYSTLLARYGIIESPTSPAYAIDNHTAYYEAPLSFVPAGYYRDGLKGIGVLVTLQSSLAASNNDAYSLQLSPSEVQPWKYEWSKWYGFAVRCVAR